MDKVQEYIAPNPVWGGVLIIAIGIFLLLDAIFDWSFIFGNVSRSNYNPEKLDGIINNRFRYYDSDAGNYISQDPIGVEGGIVLYGYVHDTNGWLDVYGLLTYNTMGKIKPMSDGTFVVKQHVIPKSLGGAGKTKYTHPAILKAGINIHDSKNIILLPSSSTPLTTRSVHPGNTTNHLVYNNRIKGKLDQIKRIGIAKGWGQADYEKVVSNLISREKANLRSGKTHLH